MLYDKPIEYTGDGLSKVKDKFLVMCSFPQVIKEIYEHGDFVATCGWLADRQMYISTEGMFVNPDHLLFRKYKTEDTYFSTCLLNQSIFDITTNWVIYPNLETMIKELEWDREKM